MKYCFFVFLIFSNTVVFAQYPLASHPYSTQSEDGFAPCQDTFSLLKFRETYDIGVILPSWLPVVNDQYVAVLEGRVENNHPEGGDMPYLSYEDLPFYHYSHDFNFNVLPDVTPDNRYTNYLPYQVHKHSGWNDTMLQSSVHIEWESGIGMSNRRNPLREANDKGVSGGFMTAGHERGDLFWNFPTVNDWVHVEGRYVWDRGHPPAKAEIHPPRFLAIKRNLPERIIVGDSSVKYATRVDMFGSADGGALSNNRYGVPKFVKRVKMSSKDYEFTVKIDLPRPSPSAVLRYELLRRKADDFSAAEQITINSDSGLAHIVIPWRSQLANDMEVYARSLFFYWDEGSGVNAALPVDAYKVRLTHLRIKKLCDYLSKAELRLFLNVGSDWIFLNDFFPKKGRILSKGMGKTYRKKWELNNEFVVYVPRGVRFRVYMSGWEVDGIDHLAGDLLDPESPCTRKTKRFIKSRIFSISKMLLKGCMDDRYGDIAMMHGFANLGKVNHFVNSPNEGVNEDPCPFSEYELKDRYTLHYTIEKLN